MTLIYYLLYHLICDPILFTLNEPNHEQIQQAKDQGLC